VKDGKVLQYSHVTMIDVIFFLLSLKLIGSMPFKRHCLALIPFFPISAFSSLFKREWLNIKDQGAFVAFFPSDQEELQVKHLFHV